MSFHPVVLDLLRSNGIDPEQVVEMQLSQRANEGATLAYRTSADAQLIDISVSLCLDLEAE